MLIRFRFLFGKARFIVCISLDVAKWVIACQTVVPETVEDRLVQGAWEAQGSLIVSKR